MADTFCALCGQSFPEGGLKYIVRIKIMSDFDGVIPPSEEDPSEETLRLLKEIDDLDVQELEDDVYQELSVYMCAHCKKKFTRELLDGEDEDLESEKKHDNLYH
jgi:hypothetical protein